MSIPSLPSRFKGILFRSRLEARWAIFFDRLGLKWEYEPEGFDLGGVAYLPDFRLHVPGVPVIHWVEVKPDHVAEDPKFALFSLRLDQTAEEPPFTIEAPLSVATLVSGDPKSFLTKRVTCQVPIERGSARRRVCPRCGGMEAFVSGTFPEKVTYCCPPCDSTLRLSARGYVAECIEGLCSHPMGFATEYFFLDISKNWPVTAFTNTDLVLKRAHAKSWESKVNAAADAAANYRFDNRR